MNKLLALTAALLISGCAGLGLTIGNPPKAEPSLPSPEAQIVFGANAVTAAATLTGTLLKNDKISAQNAKSYSAILHVASEHIKDANKALVTCRAATMSKPETRPDPCAPTVVSDIALGLSIATDVSKVLNAK